MELKELLYQEVQTLTNVENIYQNSITADYLAKRFSAKRNTISHYLNQLVKENLVIKINTRPVLFFEASKLRNYANTELLLEYASLDELQAALHSKKNVFDEIIGSKQSLYGQIRQLKAAARYPGLGLPVLLTGPTGVGKSFLAQKYYEYCVSKGYVSCDKRFIQFNCAEYADNPELLSSILFGYKKGAFTGADADKPGLFDEADGGVLFLDEIHRLNAKGQEKLFSFLDNQLIMPLGETKEAHPVKVRFICATTEDLTSNFLATFMRRIPVQIEIPALNERTALERESLIMKFYRDESIKIEQELYVSQQVLHFLTMRHYSSNVGQLKNAITLSVANALGHIKDEKIYIRLSDLPSHILQTNDLIDVKAFSQINSDFVAISPQKPISTLENTNDLLNSPIYSMFQKFIELSEKMDSEEKFKRACMTELELLCDALIYRKRIKRGGIPLSFLKNMIHSEVTSLEANYGVKFDGNMVNVLSYYFYYKQFETSDFSTYQRNIFKNMIHMFHIDEPNVSEVISIFLRSIARNLNYVNDEVDQLFLHIYLKITRYDYRLRPIRALILSHGYSTASSMADVVNKMMNEKIVDAFDMPLDIGVDDIGKELTDYINQYYISDGLLLMVDMGSLEGVSKYISGYVDFPIGIINHVSTQMALHVANEIKQNKSIDEILANVKEEIHYQSQIIYPKEIKKNLIITCCHTGIGTANQIRTLLTESMPAEVEVLVKAYDYRQLLNREQVDVLRKTFNILAIIGTSDPHISGVTYLALEDLISGRNIQVLEQILSTIEKGMYMDELNESLLHNFSIERVLNSLTILDAHTVVNHIDMMMRKFEELSHTKLTNQHKMALYIHVSCLIERLIRREPIDSYDFDGQVDDIRHTKKYIWLKNTLSVMEESYSVKIPDSEVGYIYDIISSDY
ncbi:sigma 54-interacting transcriptional regulator [Enterococcus cecorum]|uniref:sigma 54-interacting transcriptional regulator n=1 Tax=Enterococcus cecorum TaxID=44008 RepID=UPI002ACAE559|nr:sigma 54-interacting transcriptional regulator [Enterococcus cecorum]MDZ5544818.1 sigma 54-interacting transcriptional regulator [Enterococcus cecorum]